MSTIIDSQVGWEAALSALEPSSLVVLVDEHTKTACLPLFTSKYLKGRAYELLEVGSGEASKSMEQAQHLWNRMLQINIDRSAVLINLGGGMITDLGGFVASTYKRGIAFIHVPTTNLAMTDAAIGGKNGVNFGDYKNQIGVTREPSAVLIDSAFLETLTDDQLKEGFVETVKHALIADASLWDQIQAMDVLRNMEILRRSALLKKEIVTQDPLEQGIRQVLNFGHTVGHAVEAINTLSHGKSIAFGMAAEAYLSHLILGLNEDSLQEISTYLKSLQFKLGGILLTEDSLLEKMSRDKKNSGGKIRFSLISNIGKAEYGVIASDEQIKASISYAQEMLMQ